MRDVIGGLAFLSLFGLGVVTALALIKPSLFKRDGITPQRKKLLAVLSVIFLGCVFLVLWAALTEWWWLLFGVTSLSLSAAMVPHLHAAQTTPQRPKIGNPNIAPLSNHLDEIPNAPIKPEPNRKGLTDILSAIISDGMVSIEEVHFLAKWIENEHFQNESDVLFLYRKLKDYLRDDELSMDEESDLLERFNEFVSGKPKPTKRSKRKPPSVVFTSPTSDWSELTIKFDYTAATGDQSKRLVKVKRNSADRIYGYCHARGAMRTFLKNRMNNVVDVESGELLRN